MFRSHPLLSMALLAVAARPVQAASPAVDPARPASCPGALDGARVVAEIAGERISGAELDASIAAELDEARTDYLENVHKMRRSALDQLVANKLVKREARARGVDLEALLEAEVEKKTPPPTEEAIRALFDDRVKPELPEATLETFRDRLESLVTREARRERYVAFVNELKLRYAVRLALPLPELPRVTVAPTGPSAGPVEAPVTIVAFSDFQCPYCSRGAATLREVQSAYPRQVRIVFRNYPLSFHADAPRAAEAALCAHEQGRFWAMHDALFDQQQDLSEENLRELARGVAGVDAVRFDACLKSGSQRSRVETDKADAEKAGVRGTPAFFINGRRLSGAQPLEAFRELIDAELEAIPGAR